MNDDKPVSDWRERLDELEQEEREKLEERARGDYARNTALHRFWLSERALILHRLEEIDDVELLRHFVRFAISDLVAVEDEVGTPHERWTERHAASLVEEVQR